MENNIENGEFKINFCELLNKYNFFLNIRICFKCYMY